MDLHVYLEGLLLMVSVYRCELCIFNANGLFAIAGVIWYLSAISDGCMFVYSLSQNESVPCGNISYSYRFPAGFGDYVWHMKFRQDNIRNYKSTLRQLLSLIPVSYAAIQDDRDSQAHRQAVHEYHDNIVNACIRAAEATIPHAKRRGRAGWKRHAEPQKKNAILWNRIWKESGSPNTGIIHSIRQTTRAEYRRASRWVVRNEEKLKADNMTDTLHSKDFWTEIQRTQQKHTSTTTKMDGERG
ncbi:hypothetical protein CAPTEDRAFT_202758 [Capitella teleta]|uniref:Uncharacterized protein n=1 Tax=Capitella teleta TaxID=283909 RepID=R7TIM7_CAPTE|nr:hypothetical protein CAPTEDRAFT_202758 [Capitella teleta]|eukprot:ELT90940.1 hypothetical protein CAPTEDRAFT_202758 [Capitella teleta]